LAFTFVCYAGPGYSILNHKAHYKPGLLVKNLPVIPIKLNVKTSDW